METSQIKRERITNRIILRLTALVLLAAMLIAIASQAGIVAEAASGSMEIVRLGGADRLETACLIADEGWDEASAAVLASSQSFPDALAGVPLAKALDAPILLVSGNSVAPAVSSQLKELNTKSITLLGGTAAISGDIEKQLKGSGYTVTRIGGKNRYETSSMIAKQLYTTTQKTPTKLYFAYGGNYPDALAISSVAAIEGNPILYAPNKGGIDSSVSSYVKGSGCKEGVILGGTAGISAPVEEAVKKLGLSTTRICGIDRYQTAYAICNAYNEVFDGEGIAFATGRNYPDALAGGAFAAKLGIPLVFSDNALVSAEAKSYAQGHIARAYVFGGTGAVSDAIVSEHFTEISEEYVAGQYLEALGFYYRWVYNLYAGEKTYGTVNYSDKITAKGGSGYKNTYYAVKYRGIKSIYDLRQQFACYFTQSYTDRIISNLQSNALIERNGKLYYWDNDGDGFNPYFAGEAYSVTERTADSITLAVKCYEYAEGSDDPATIHLVSTEYVRYSNNNGKWQFDRIIENM